MMAYHMAEDRSSSVPEAYSTRIAGLREVLLRLLGELERERNDDARERAEQAIAALYRLEWALRGDGRTEIALPAGRQ